MNVAWYMDSTACQAAVSSITSTRDALVQQLNHLKASADAMVGNTWLAPGALIFQQQFQDWYAMLSAEIDKLNIYASSLDQEIIRWNDEQANIPILPGN
jgi:uncharacterized protein YukE